MSVVDSEVRVLTDAERAKRDRILHAAGRMATRRLRRYRVIFALLRWVR